MTLGMSRHKVFLWFPTILFGVAFWQAIGLIQQSPPHLPWQIWDERSLWGYVAWVAAWASCRSFEASLK